MKKQKLAAALSVGAVAMFTAGLTAGPAFAFSEPTPSPNPCPNDTGSASNGTLTICTNPATDPGNTQGGNHQTATQCSGLFGYQLLVQALDKGGATFPVQTPVTWTVTDGGTHYVYLFGTAYPGGVPTSVVGSTIQTPTGDIDGISAAGISIISATPGYNYGFIPPPPGNPVAPVLTNPVTITITASAAGYGTTSFTETLQPCGGNGIPFAPFGGGIGLAAVAGGTLYLTQRRRRRDAASTPQRGYAV